MSYLALDGIDVLSVLLWKLLVIRRYKAEPDKNKSFVQQLGIIIIIILWEINDHNDALMISTPRELQLH